MAQITSLLSTAPIFCNFLSSGAKCLSSILQRGRWAGFWEGLLYKHNIWTLKSVLFWRALGPTPERIWDWSVCTTHINIVWCSEFCSILHGQTCTQWCMLYSRAYSLFIHCIMPLDMWYSHSTLDTYTELGTFLSGNKSCEHTAPQRPDIEMSPTEALNFWSEPFWSGPFWLGFEELWGGGLCSVCARTNKCHTRRT